MKEKTISIKSLNDVYTFINKAQEVEGDVTVKRGRFNVYAKSVMGVFSIDMSQNVTVVFSATETEFDEFLDQFKVNR